MSGLRRKRSLVRYTDIAILHQRGSAGTLTADETLLTPLEYAAVAGLLDACAAQPLDFYAFVFHSR